MHIARMAFLAALLAAGGCGPTGDGDGDADLDADLDGDGDGDAGDPDADRDAPPDVPFAVTGVNPGHGVFSGFSPVVVRGRGFEGPVQVFFGEREVHPDTIAVVDENRIACLTPPGEPGSFVDVRVVQGEEEAILEGGFYYDPCSVDPGSGSVSGGTFVVIACLGTEFAGGETVTFDGLEAVGVETVGPTEIHLRTPAGAAGPADVEITSVAGEIELASAFVYFANTDPTSGGLGGDPVAGNVELTVFDASSGAPLGDSYVILGVDGGTEYQGRTDEAGTIVFSGPDLRGRQLIITVSHGPVPTPIDMDCDDVPDIELQTFYQTASFTEFDATYVSVLLVPIPPMVMVPPCDPPPTPRPSFIEGELMFESGGEFGPYEWRNVPEPLPPDEEKVSYVFTTAADIFYDGPPAGSELYETGTIPGGRGSLVTEDDVGVEGFSYRIQSRYGALAVYAIAGIRNRRTGAFTPYAFGIHRGVLVNPGETVENVDILMVTALDESVVVRLDDPPTPQGWDVGPNRYIVELYVDLGVEGVIWRSDRLSTRSTASGLHYFPSWMPREAALRDATLTVVANAYSFDVDPYTGEERLVYPFAIRYLRGVTNWLADVVVSDWVWPSQLVDPGWGGTVVRDHFEWTNGAGDFDFTHIMIQRGMPWWDLVLPSSQQTLDLPPLPAEFATDVSGAQLDIWHHRVMPGFVYDRWSYDHFGRNYQTAFSANAWLVSF